MSVIIFFTAIAIGCIYFFINEYKNQQGIFTSIRIGFIYSLIIFAFLTYLFCELLSINNSLNEINLSVAWAIVLIVFAIKVYKLKWVWESPVISLPQMYVVYIGFTILLILIPLLILSIFIPPNNWDSMSYHMTRVEEWRQNLNVYPFPTSNIRQINVPPLAEYIILNLQILSHSDYFANLIQFVSLLGTLSLGSLFVKLFGLDFKAQLFTILLILAIPMVIFQSTSTQTDLTAAFFFIAVVYFIFKILRSAFISYNDIILVSASLSLGGLVKYTVLVFSAPFLIILFFFIIKKASLKSLILYILIGIFISVIVFAPFLFRNYSYYGNIAGETELLNSMGVSNPNVNKMLGNVAKNITDSMAIPWGNFNAFLFQISCQLHNLLRIQINSQETNFSSSQYGVIFVFAEDSAGSAIHLVFFFITFLIFLFKCSRVKNHLLIIHYSCLIFSFLTYSFLFKWQPWGWGNRLLLPLFILAILGTSITGYKFIFKSHFYSNLVFILLILYCLPTVYLNKNKPIVNLYLSRTILKKPLGMIPKVEFDKQPIAIQNKFLNYYLFKENVYLIKILSKDSNVKLFEIQDSLNLFKDEKISIFQKPRIENYFVNQPYSFHTYSKLFDSIPRNRNRISLEIRGDTYEYPIWVFARKKFGNNFKIGHAGFNFKFKSRNNFPPSPNDIVIFEHKNRLETKYRTLHFN